MRVLVVLLLLAMPAQATMLWTAEDVESPAWLDVFAPEEPPADPDAMPPPDNRSEQHFAWGDVDADGNDDLATLARRPGAEQQTVVVRAGPEFERVLVNGSAPASAWPTIDVNGDGIVDMFDASWDGEQVTWTYLSGGNLAPLRQERFPYREDAELVGALGTGVHARHNEMSSLYALGDGVFWIVHVTYEADGVSVLGSPVESRHLALSVQETTAAGDARWWASADEEQAWGLGLVDLDLDGRVEPFIGVDVELAPDVNGMAHARAFVHVYGPDGLHWSHDLGEDISSNWLYGHGVGDLDDDGWQELYLIVERPLKAQGFRFEGYLLSGADGSVLWEGDALLQGFLPFGDTDRDGRHEALRLQAVPGGHEASAVGADLRPKWTAELAVGESVVNAALEDWDGDGVPDLALHDVRDGAGLRLLSGADGAEVWRTSIDVHERVWTAAGSLEPGFAYLGVEGTFDEDAPYRGVRTDLVFIAGASGEEAWRTTLLDGHASEAWPENATIRILAGAAGDVNGDGTQDLLGAIHVESEHNGSRQQTSAWWPLSGADGHVVRPYTPPATTGPASPEPLPDNRTDVPAPLPAPPEPSPVVADEAAAKDAPTAALPLVLAALWLLARRR